VENLIHRFRDHFPIELEESQSFFVVWLLFN